MNVLITSCGQKVMLVEAFRAAASRRGGLVVAADCDPTSAGLFAADRAVLLPRVDTSGYVEALLASCGQNEVRLVVPSSDRDLAALAPHRAAFATQAIAVLVPSEETLSLCQHKGHFVAFCSTHGFATPRTFGANEEPDRFPVFVRPSIGAGGVGARMVGDAGQLHRLRAVDPDLLVQEFEAASEWSVDVLMDLNGRPVQAVTRRRLAIRAGESFKSETHDEPVLADASLRLCAALGLIGHNVVQAFFDGGDDKPRFIEINPRYGGASNLSIQAGLASPDRILGMVAGEDEQVLRPRPIRHGLVMLRYARDLLVDRVAIAGIGNQR